MPFIFGKTLEFRMNNIHIWKDTSLGGITFMFGKTLEFSMNNNHIWKDT